MATDTLQTVVELGVVPWKALAAVDPITIRQTIRNGRKYFMEKAALPA